MSDPIVDPAPSATAAPDRTTLPDWARKEISDANDEAARRRVELRDTNAQLEAANTAVQTSNDEKVAAVDRAVKAEAGLLKFRVALSVGVPGDEIDEFAELLVGTTEDELKEHAAKIRKFRGDSVTPGRATDPSQGLGNNGTSATSTNIALSPGAAAFADLVRGQLAR